MRHAGRGSFPVQAPRTNTANSLRHLTFEGIDQTPHRSGAVFAITWDREMPMMMTNSQVAETFEILIGELMADDELRESFLRDPDYTLRIAGDWALPLSD